MMYAARIEDETVVEVIVGDADWAMERLGGFWIPSNTKAGIGWRLVKGKLVAPAPDPVFTGDLL
jgi:hypothetical protein